LETDTENRYFQLAGRDMVYMKFILEAYEGMCTMSTIDGKRGIVQVNYTLPWAEDVARLMEALAGEITIVEVTREGEPCSKP
jgi:shikimate 5-dehydrogenase